MALRVRWLTNINPGQQFQPQKSYQKSPPNPARSGVYPNEVVNIPAGNYVRTTYHHCRTIGNQEYYEAVSLKDGRKFYLPVCSKALVEE